LLTTCIDYNTLFNLCQLKKEALTGNEKGDTRETPS